MEFQLARAMQVSCLSDGQLSQLHERETALGRILQNHEAQSFLRISSIKDICGIPDDAEAQAAHAGRIRKAIADLELTKKAEGEGSVAECNMEKTHAFDWAVIHHRSRIVWDYSGGKRSSRLKELVEG